MQPIRRVIQRFKNWFNYRYRRWRHREAATVYSLFAALSGVLLSNVLPFFLPLRFLAFAACGLAFAFFVLFSGNEIYLINVRKRILASARKRIAEDLFFTQWVDFVRFTGDPEQIQTTQQRLETKGAVRHLKRHTEQEETIRFLVQRKDIVLDWDNDVFESMRIGRYGGVTLWTNNKVWYTPAGFPHDKIVYVERNPPAMEITEAVANEHDKMKP